MMILIIKLFCPINNVYGRQSALLTADMVIACVPVLNIK